MIQGCRKQVEWKEGYELQLVVMMVMGCQCHGTTSTLKREQPVMEAHHTFDSKHGCVKLNFCPRRILHPPANRLLGRWDREGWGLGMGVKLLFCLLWGFAPPPLRPGFSLRCSCVREPCFLLVRSCLASQKCSPARTSISGNFAETSMISILFYFCFGAALPSERP